MIIKYIERSVGREGPKVMVGLGWVGCKDEKDRKENIKRNKLKNLYTGGLRKILENATPQSEGVRHTP